jgi:DNA-binding winged helix-turn-helix (wHTH) protein
MPAKVQSSRRVQFSAYVFDPATGDLTRQGIRLRLETQPAKVLELLIAADGDLVLRSDLIAALWPGQIEGDFDRRLDKAIAKLRACLNDDPAKPRYIETLKGRGYRFLHEVVVDQADPGQEGATPYVGVPSSVEPVQSQSDTEAPHESFVPSTKERGFFHSLLTVPWVTAFAGLTLTVILTAWWLEKRYVTHPHSRPVVLIFGFQDISNSSEEVWVSHSVAEWLSTDLGSGGDLQPIQAGNNPEFRARAAETGCSGLPAKALETARRAFDADWVVYGDYSTTENGISGDRWRLNVCLESARDRKNPESMTVVGTQGDIAQLVSNAGEVLRSKLGLKPLSSQSLGYLRATLPSNLGAARLYAEGTSALEHFEPEEASALLTQAAQIEPQHAPTHAALSTAWTALGYQQRSQQEALIARDLAKGLSPTQQLEYAGLADEAEHDWPAAVETYGKLLQLHPDSVDYGLKLAHAQTNAVKAPLALATLRTLRTRNEAALLDPRVDLAEAAADSALSDFRAQLAVSIQAESRAAVQSAGLLVADARMEQGNADDMLGNWGEALRLWRLAGQVYESIGDRGGMADALNHQADLAWKKGDAENATKLFKESISLSKTIGDNARMAYSLSREGTVRMAMDRAPGGEMPEAVAMYRQAAAIYHDIGNTAEEGYVISLMGDEAMQRVRFEEARAYYNKAMALSRAASDKSRIAGRLLDLGIVNLAEGHNPESIQFFQQSSRMYDELGQKDRAAIARIRLATSLFQAGKAQDAERMQQDSLAIMRSFGRLNQVREALFGLGITDLVLNPVKAETALREYLDLEKTVETQRPCCVAGHALLAEILLAQGRVEEAKSEIREAFSAPQERVTPLEILPYILRARGSVKMSENDYAGAEVDFKRAMEMLRARGARFNEMEARLGLTELHIRQRGQSAMPELERFRQEADQLGYGIFDIKIDAFLRPLHPAQ